MESNKKIKIHFTIDDEQDSRVCLIDSSFNMKKTLQFIRNKKNDQNLNYIYISNSIIEDLDDLLSDWFEPDLIFNFRHSKAAKKPDEISKSSTNYNFKIFTTSNWESLTAGENFSLNKDMKHDQLKDLIQDYCSIKSHIPISQMKLFIYLPGGIEFDNNNTTLKDFVETAKPEKLHIYVVVSLGVSTNVLTKEIVEICDVRDEMSTLMSPFVESSSVGKQLFACLLSSIFHQTTGRKELIKSLSKVTGFPPLIISLQSIIDRKTITGKDLLMITSPLFTIFKYFLDNTVADVNILESCTKLCNLISQIDDSTDAPLEKHTKGSTTDTTIDKNKLSYIERYMENKSLTSICFWKPDFEKKEFQKKQALPYNHNQLKDAWEEKQHFKPVMPLSLLQVHVSSIVYGPNETYRVFVMDSLNTKEIEASSKVDLINPETGQTTHEEIESFAKNVKEKTVEGEKIELIDEESVQQITMVLIDQSESMGWKFSKATDLTRDYAAKQFLTSWASKSFGYRISSLQGLISFGSTVTVKSELSPLIPDFEKSVMEINPKGGTALWQALKLGAEKLVDKKIDPKTKKPKFKKAASRLLVLTDGENSIGDLKPYDILPYLIENNIVVDTVITSLNASSNDMCILTHLTGGLAFKPSTIEEGVALFEKEALLSITYREKPQPFTSTITEDVFNSYKSKLFYDKEPKNTIIMQAKTKQPLMTPRAAVKGLDGTSQNRLKRISKELRIAHRWEDKEVKVYPVENLADRWRIYIKGPESTLYENKWWDIFATFPENYPYSPPVFRFITVPYHINISDEGRICMNTLGSDYSSSMNVMELIANIKALLIIPNYDDPIDVAKLTLYNKSPDHHEFIEKIKESSQNAQPNIDNYLKNICINDAADYVVPQEIYVPAQQRDPITGKPMDPANTVVASSGIKYDRDSLKRLLRSSKTPKCVITHKILTDNPDML